MIEDTVRGDHDGGVGYDGGGGGDADQGDDDDCIELDYCQLSVLPLISIASDQVESKSISLPSHYKSDMMMMRMMSDMMI